MIITIVGSMRYSKLMCLLVEKFQSNMKDCIVFIPDLSNIVIYGSEENKYINDTELSNLKAKHYKLIEISDYVLCIDYHIGNSTKDELKYAKKLKKTVIMLSEIVHYFKDDDFVMKAIKGD